MQSRAEHLHEEQTAPRRYADQMRKFCENFSRRVPDMREDDFSRFWAFCLRKISSEIHGDRGPAFELQLIELVTCPDRWLDAYIDWFQEEQAVIRERLDPISSDCLAVHDSYVTVCKTPLAKYPEAHRKSEKPQ